MDNYVAFGQSFMLDVSSCDPLNVPRSRITHYPLEFLPGGFPVKNEGVFEFGLGSKARTGG